MQSCWFYQNILAHFHMKSFCLNSSPLVSHLQPSALQKSFPSDRLQQVSLNGVKSDWIELEQGVPQGTILGPLLLNLYANY